MSKLRDNNGRFTAVGNMIADSAPDHEVDGFNFRSIGSHLTEFDNLLRADVLADIIGNRSTHAHESAGFGYFTAAASSFVYGVDLQDGSAAQQDVFYQATLIRNFGLAHYQMDDTGRSLERMQGAIQWILNDKCPTDKEIDPEVLMEEFDDLSREEAEELIKEEQTHMIDNVRVKLEGFLNGARYDDIPDRIPSEWDERGAFNAIRGAAGSVLRLLERDIAKCKKGKLKAIMRGKPQKTVDYWKAEQAIVEYEYDICSTFINRHNLVWD